MTCNLQITELLRIVRAKNEYTPILRVAALRNLIALTPIEITKGRCYIERRKLVRSHYKL